MKGTINNFVQYLILIPSGVDKVKQFYLMRAYIYIFEKCFSFLFKLVGKNIKDTFKSKIFLCDITEINGHGKLLYPDPFIFPLQCFLQLRDLFNVIFLLPM